MSNRKSLSKRVRFEIFSRDRFICQYCGKTPPEVALEIDHLVPLSKGGTDDKLNLITACILCNRGKGITLLSDPSVVDSDVEFRRIQQEILEAKRYLDAVTQLETLNTQIFNKIQNKWYSAFRGVNIGRLPDRQAKNWLRNYPADEVFNAIDIVAEYINNGKKFNEIRGIYAYMTAILKNRKDCNAKE